MGGTYIFYSLLLAFMISFSLPSVKADSYYELPQPGQYWRSNVTSIILLYTFIIGCRYLVGLDYEAYLGWYIQLTQTGVYPRDIEFGYEMLNKLLYYLHAHFSFLFIIIAFLQIFFLYKSLQKFPFILPWYIFFFFTTLLMFSSMNIMRQTLAYFIFFYALNEAIEKRFLKVTLLCIFGFSFHKSMLIVVMLIPLLGFDWFKNKYIQLGLLFFVTVFSSRILDFVLQTTAPIISLVGYDYYVENLDYMREITEANTVGAGTSRLLFFVIDLVVILTSDRLKVMFNEYHFYKYYNLYFAGALLERIVYDNFILARTNDYLLNFRTLILSFLCFHLFSAKSNRVLKQIVGTFIVLAMLAFFYRAIYNAAAQTSPFRFLFFEENVSPKAIDDQE